ncbi:hypothetical protein [Caldalkalibacillus mannanilyticus]|uniref:hypothetical protein n=1 Tax=Caldalkalibacillus mannanilyticus TaxID=1418 RepID=UPI00046AEF2E|nr:hypothetical protein [Caldalkalibacillus mannanilyticus]
MKSISKFMCVALSLIMVFTATIHPSSISAQSQIELPEYDSHLEPTKESSLEIITDTGDTLIYQIQNDEETYLYKEVYNKEKSLTENYVYSVSGQEKTLVDYYETDEAGAIIDSDEYKEESISLLSTDFQTEEILKNEDQYIYRMTVDGILYEYHELYNNNSTLTEHYTYLIENEEKTLIDSYHTDQNGTIIDEISYNPDEIKIMCGPPCGYIAVVAVRLVVKGVTSYAIRRTASSATIATVSLVSKSRAASALRNYTTHTFQSIGRTFSVTPRDMNHFYVRHHPTYFAELNISSTQTFFVKTMDWRILNHIATQATQRNALALRLAVIQKQSFKQVHYTYNGITYRVGVNLSSNRITQLYSTKTYWPN